jgi:hypothetical protein
MSFIILQHSKELESLQSDLREYSWRQRIKKQQ